MMESTEDKSHEKKWLRIKKLQKINQGLIQPKQKKKRKNWVKKDLNHRRINQDRVHKQKQNGQRNKIIKNIRTIIQFK